MSSSGVQNSETFLFVCLFVSTDMMGDSVNRTIVSYLGLCEQVART
jgi:hypothetical protein